MNIFPSIFFLIVRCNFFFNPWCLKCISNVETFFRIENLYFQFIHKSFKKIVLSDFIVQFYKRNKTCQKCHFKQHWYPWPIFQDASFSPLGFAKICQIHKIQRFDKSDKYFRFDHRVYWSKQSLSEILF